MRRSKSILACLAACVLMTLAATFNAVQAETYTALVPISAANEVPPVPNLNATGVFQITVEVTRDNMGTITAGKVNFLGIVQGFPAGTEVTGLHIHEGSALVAAGAVFPTDVSGTAPIILANGAGIIDRPATTVPLAALGRFLSNPTGFYVNIHTRVNGSGALRGQLTKLTETLVNTVTMNTAEEIPAPSGQPGSALTALTFNPTRNALGVINGGTVWFTLHHDFTGPITFTGLHIHEAAAGVAGGVVINTGVSGAAPIVSATGKGFINIPVLVPAPGASATAAANQIGALTRLVANPAGFYVNIHTAANPGGVIRAQLTSLGAAPAIVVANKYFLPTGNADATISILAAGVDLLSSVLINGQQVLAIPDLATGAINVTVPAALLANPGVLQMQIKGGNGNHSLPLSIPVAAATSVNSQAVATLDAAGFSPAAVAAESIAASFGTRLASQIVANAAAVLPLELDGTSVYVNGVRARLFFVSPGQINFEVPPGTLAGPAAVVVVARDGAVSQGQVLVTNTAPGLFTRLANGRGAPAAVASTDNGATFAVAMGNADGTPVEVSAGNIVQLFGTGLRFKSAEVNATAGGVTAMPSFVGPAPGLQGVDQINLTIPATMAGKGEMDLVFSIDNKPTNAVRIKVK